MLLRLIAAFLHHVKCQSNRVKVAVTDMRSVKHSLLIADILRMQRTYPPVFCAWVVWIDFFIKSHIQQPILAEVSLLSPCFIIFLKHLKDLIMLLLITKLPFLRKMPYIYKCSVTNIFYKWKEAKWKAHHIIIITIFILVLVHSLKRHFSLKNGMSYTTKLTAWASRV